MTSVRYSLRGLLAVVLAGAAAVVMAQAPTVKLGFVPRAGLASYGQEVIAALGAQDAGEPGMRPFAMLDDVAAGKLSAAWVPLTYVSQSRTDGAFDALANLPFGLDGRAYVDWRASPATVAAADQALGRYGVKTLVCGALPESAGLWSTKPIETLDDLRGLRLRGTGPFRELKALGVQVLELPLGEAAPAAARKLIDATAGAWLLFDVRTLDFPQVLPMYAEPAIYPVRGVDLLLNAGYWQGLPAQTRARVESACRGIAERMYDQLARETRAARDQLVRQGVRVYRLPDPVVAALREALDASNGVGRHPVALMLRDAGGRQAKQPGSTPVAGGQATDSPGPRPGRTGGPDPPGPGPVAGGEVPVAPAPPSPGALPPGSGGSTRPASGSSAPLTEGDLASCRSEINRFHRLAIDYFAAQEKDSCDRSKRYFRAENCTIARQGRAEVAGMGAMRFYMQGNGTCNATDYPCFGPRGLEGLPEDFLRTLLERPTSDLPNDIEGYSVIVDQCAARVLTAKRQGRQPGAVPVAAPVAPAPGSTRALSAAEIAECSDTIKRTQRESMSWPGDSREKAGRLGRFQKELFEGRCAGHPEARAYIAGAEKMLTDARGGGGKGSPGESLDHNPVHDAVSCVKLYGPAEMKALGRRGVLPSQIENTCAFPIEVRWCIEASATRRGDCNPGYSNSISLGVRGGAGTSTYGVDATDQTVHIAACRKGERWGFQPLKTDPRRPFAYACK